MAVSCEQFIRQIAESGLMTADDVAAVVERLSADKKPQDDRRGPARVARYAGNRSARTMKNKS